MYVTGKPYQNDNSLHIIAGQINNSLKYSFEPNVGLKQQDGLAPLLFKLALKQVIPKWSVDTKGTLLYKLCLYKHHARSFISAREIFITWKI